MHRVVRPFPVSWDGLTLVDLSIGDERDFGDMTAGLLAEGYIEAVKATAVKATEAAGEPAGDDNGAEEPVEIETTTAAKRPYKKRN